ncbi:hypothetical protein L210DRAFT_3131369 [Boletus edulis BED1]|uniref:Uncharacterized protein n=1 Tax=Boletus edulis BED1 TaxID=1328754 RepID=A0AAD4BGL6_BOLED|nr:hypothetical protein L210DRAFT_3131369 [Boletus edulis BED1]
MERSRKILCKIASASREVVAVANNYADREDYNCVSRCHFQLEEDMRRISVACECLADIPDKPSPQEGHAVDVRIQDWVVTEEPQVCLDTLSRMKSLLQQKENTSSWASRMFRGGRSSTTTGMQDKIKEAVDLFNSYKGCFHLLFSTELWNNESAVQRQHHTPQSRAHSVKGKSDLFESRPPIITQVDDTVVPLDPGVQGGHAEQEVSNIVVQGLPTGLRQRPG